MRFFTIHLKDKNGGLVDYMTGEKTLTKLTDKYENVLMYLTKKGFTQVKATNVSKPQTKPLESTTQTEKYCPTCGKLMTYKEGISKSGKPWKGYFCPERAHDPIWVK